MSFPFPNSLTAELTLTIGTPLLRITILATDKNTSTTPPVFISRELTGSIASFQVGDTHVSGAKLHYDKLENLDGNCDVAGNLKGPTIVILFSRNGTVFAEFVYEGLMDGLKEGIITGPANWMILYTDKD